VLFRRYRSPGALSPGLPPNSTVNLLVANGVMVLVSTVTVWLKSLSLKMLTPLSVTIALETPALSIRIVNEAERSRTLNVTVTGVGSPLSRVNCIGPKDTNVPANVVIEMPKKNKALRVHCNAVACVKDVLTRHLLMRHSPIDPAICLTKLDPRAVFATKSN
jgi:hypothetical protein